MEEKEKWWASCVAQLVKNPPAMQETLAWENPMEESMATHSNILAWRIPMDCSPWGHKELATTERLSRAQEKW